jgi:hypothetical protein
VAIARAFARSLGEKHTFDPPSGGVQHWISCLGNSKLVIDEIAERARRNFVTVLGIGQFEQS